MKSAHEVIAKGRFGNNVDVLERLVKIANALYQEVIVIVIIIH